MVQQQPLSSQKPKRKNFALLKEIADPQPVYLRVAMASHKYGLSRTRLFQLLAEGTLKSRYVTRPGTKRGIRLIDASSLEAYINSFGPKEEAANA
jgi:hypothetical protein